MAEYKSQWNCPDCKADFEGSTEAQFDKARCPSCKQLIIRCPQCATKRPEKEMKSRRIHQIRSGSLVTETMMFCADAPCGGHYQMGCEG